MTNSIGDPTEYGIIGWPLDHSFSPAYFTDKFRKEGIDATYTAYPLPDIAALQDLLQAHPRLRGLNVTIPYKTSVIPFLDSLSPDASAIGAVNCISVLPEGLVGFNTDWTGFRDSLQPLLQPQHKTALVFGSGGAAKAVVYALQQLGIKYDIVSRGGSFMSYEQVTPELLSQTFLLINTTPLGMHPDEDRAPELPYECLTAQHLLYDLIYNPAGTRFLTLGKAQGAAVKNGLEMLHLQAKASWEIWQS